MAVLVAVAGSLLAAVIVVTIIIRKLLRGRCSSASRSIAALFNAKLSPRYYAQLWRVLVTYHRVTASRLSATLDSLIISLVIILRPLRKTDRAFPSSLSFPLFQGKCSSSPFFLRAAFKLLPFLFAAFQCCCFSLQLPLCCLIAALVFAS